jgi:hypothetical protein
MHGLFLGYTIFSLLFSLPVFFLHLVGLVVLNNSIYTSGVSVCLLVGGWVDE